MAGFQEEIQFEVLRRLHQTPQGSQRTLANSILVGDKPSNILAGITAGVRTNFLFSDDTFVELAGLDCLPVRALKDFIPCLEGALTAMAQR